MKRGILLLCTMYFFFGNFLNSKLYHHYIVLEKEFEHYADVLLEGYGNSELGSPIEFKNIPQHIWQSVNLPHKNDWEFNSREEASDYHAKMIKSFEPCKYRLWKRTKKKVSSDILFDFFAKNLPQYGDAYIEKRDKNDPYSVHPRYTVKGYGIKLNFDKKILEENNVQKFDPNIKDWCTYECCIIAEDSWWGMYSKWWCIPLEEFKKSYCLFTPKA